MRAQGCVLGKLFGRTTRGARATGAGWPQSKTIHIKRMIEVKKKEVFLADFSDRISSGSYKHIRVVSYAFTCSCSI